MSKYVPGKAFFHRQTDGGIDGRTDRHSSKTVFSSIHVVEWLLFSMFPLILTFDIDPILGPFFRFFFGPKWIIFGLGIRLEKYLGVHSLIHTNNFCLPFSCSICNLNFSMDGQTDKITYRSCPQSLENHVITMLQESTRNRLSIRLNMYVWIRFICDAWFGSNIDVFHGGGGRPPP